MSKKLLLFIVFSTLLHAAVLMYVQLPKKHAIPSAHTPLSLFKKKAPVRPAPSKPSPVPVIKQKTVLPKKAIAKSVTSIKPKKMIQKKAIVKKIVPKPVEPVQQIVEIPTPVVPPMEADKVTSVSDNATSPAPVPPITVVTSSPPTFNVDTYRQTVISSIKHNIEYPRIARKRGLEGKFNVRLDIEKSGKIKNISFIMENGSQILKKAILKGIEHTTVIPPELSAITLYLPVEFRLND